MARLVPAIHVFLAAKALDVDARDKRGHDESELMAYALLPSVFIFLDPQQRKRAQHMR